MILDAKFILTVAKLAIELGENVVAPIVEAFHSDKTLEQKKAAMDAVDSVIKSSKCIEVAKVRDAKL